MVTNGGGSETRLESNKIVLAAKTILFYFRRDVWNEIKLFERLK